MEATLLGLAYLVASVLFILSLRGLSSQETARSGNLFGMVGMAIAVGATLTDPAVVAHGWVIAGVAIGSGIGAVMALRVPMTKMPELVALLHSFVGAAAVLVGFAHFMHEAKSGHVSNIVLIEVFVDVFIGAITFTGSVVAFLKLSQMVSTSPLLLPGRHILNAAATLACIWLGIEFVRAGGDVVPLAIMTGIASLMGIHLVAAIGGADMPVVVSMLNSYSGWTAAAAGFMLSNNLLIVTGALVGSSGAILSYIMCRAMNRSIWNVIFGGFGTSDSKSSAATPQEDPGDLQVAEIEAPATAQLLREARRVIIVPGYGMAAARAQNAVHDVVKWLRDRKVDVRFAIHPVAGRLPGHMNVLLAEADVPYDIVLEMDEINDDFPRTDVALVIGANDIVNPSADTDESSPIYGMPVLHVWKAEHVIICKRSRRAGYAGVDNPLFYGENSQMLFGDARDTMEQVVTQLRASEG